MPRIGLCPAAVAAAVAIAGGALVTAQQFRASVDLVHLPVVVTARDGSTVAGLTRDDFEVYEDGQRQDVTLFTEGAPGAALPLHLGLLLDSSESMERDLKAASNAAVRFVDQLVEAVDVTFVDFDTGVRIGRFSPPSYPHLFERIRAGRASGGTALYDALGVYIQSTLDRSGQHVVLIHTDGGDSTSSMSYGRLQELLRQSDVIVYAVGYLEHQLTNARIPQQMRVAQIARETGGDAFFPSSREEIDEAYEKIRAEIASRYTLGYVSANARADGRFRKVEVRLARTDLAGAKVRTRAGYLAPGDGRR